MTETHVDVWLPPKLECLFHPAPFKILWGGRGGAKSWGISRALLIMGAREPLRILCCREIQRTIADSVHSLLKDQIGLLGLSGHYRIQETAIIGTNGTQFAFSGLKNASSLKSYEGFDRAWVEEAQVVSKSSWQTLIPTIRKAGSEIWASFNPILESDDTYQRFVLHPPPGAVVVKIGWRDNPFLSDKFHSDRLHAQQTDPDYDHVYEGVCRTTVEGAYYAEQLAAMDKDGRLTRIPYDKMLPVHTFWDLGIGDCTSIWFVQAYPLGEYHLIDYLEDSGREIGFYLQTLQSRGYVYAMHHLPHDAQARELGTGKTIEELVRAVYADKVDIVTKLSVMDGINAGRTIFGQCWFDIEKCADGIQALRHYRKAPADTLGRDTGPLHDWSSHGADSFRYFAVGVRRPEHPKKKAPPQYSPGGEHSWMA